MVCEPRTPEHPDIVGGEPSASSRSQNAFPKREQLLFVTPRPFRAAVTRAVRSSDKRLMFSIAYQTHHDSPFISDVSSLGETFPARQGGAYTQQLPAFTGRDGVELPVPQTGLQDCFSSHMDHPPQANLDLAPDFFPAQ